MKINTFNHIILSSLTALLFSGCELKNPIKPEPRHYEVTLQPGPEGEDTFVKFEARYPNVFYHNQNFGDSSRIQIIYIGYPYANQVKSEGIFKIPAVLSLEDTLNIDSVSLSLYGKAWSIPFCDYLPVFKVNGLIEDFEEDNTCWDDSLKSDMIDYDVQSVDTSYCWTTWNLGNYYRLKNLKGIVIRPLEYGPYWLSDYGAYSSDEMDNIQFRPKWMFYGSSK